MNLVSADQARKLEQIAIEELGIPSIILMENASLRAAKHCLKYLTNIRDPKVLVVCGSGNNGGDGFAVARHLRLKGIESNVILIGDAGLLKNDSKTNFDIINKLGISIDFFRASENNNDKSGYVVSSFSSAASHESNPKRFYGSDFEKYDLIVDAIFGTGLTRDISGIARDVIEDINRYAKYIISVDIPSGVGSDNGKIMGIAVKANETVTFNFPKKGLYLFPGADCTGIIHIEDISIPRSLINRIDVKTKFLTDDETAALLPVRKRRSNKGDFGKALIFAGSEGMPGAAALACSGAYMTGCGLVRACVTRNTASVIHHWQREVVTRIAPEKNGMYFKESLDDLKEEIDNADVIALGPGIGRSEDVSEFVYEVIRRAKAPLALDADALFAVSEYINILKELKAPCVITPHPGEMSRLINLPVPKILEDTIAAASGFSKEFNVVTLLKDAHTIIADPDGEIIINTTGNNALSKAGTGDVLTGMIAGFIAQGKNVLQAAALGAHIHGKSCEIACVNKSKYSVTAEDIIKNIPAAMNGLVRQPG